ncbi:unnamed protein product [Ectocarpus sp. CCAP 1310/34]|nr:unnamed protein product [Ectocarpus sp. CCAP 1310/34]
MSYFTTQREAGTPLRRARKCTTCEGAVRLSCSQGPKAMVHQTCQMAAFCRTKNTKRKKTRGTEKRTQYSNRKEAAVVAELRELEADHADKIWHVHGVSCQQFLARKTGIPQPNICKWNGDAEKLIAAAANDLKNDLFKTGIERRWFGDAEKAALDSLLLQPRKRKLGVSTAWIRVNARKLVMEMYPDDPRAKSFSASDRWCRKFAKRHHPSKRRRTNMKNKSVEDRLPQMKSFHRRLRQLLQEPPVRRAAAGGEAENNGAAIVPVKSPLYGRFSLDARFTVDQVGLAFVNGLDSTWDETGALRCTVNCCIGAGDKLMRTAVIFRGEGKVLAVEKAAYDPGVDVLFQENAWMDGPTCMAWAKNSFLRSITGEEGVVPEEQPILFADNLHAQTTDEFNKSLHGECNTLLRLLHPKLTDELQPVDTGYGRLLTVEVAGARRILFTRFIAREVARMDARPGYRHRLFEKAGLAMTADGSLDDRITPEGVVGAYNFMDGGTSSDEEMPDQDDEVGDDDWGAGGGESSCDSDAISNDGGEYVA